MVLAILRNRETAEALSVVFENTDVFLQETHFEIGLNCYIEY